MKPATAGKKLICATVTKDGVVIGKEIFYFLRIHAGGNYVYAQRILGAFLEASDKGELAYWGPEERYYPNKASHELENGGIITYALATDDDIRDCLRPENMPEMFIAEIHLDETYHYDSEDRARLERLIRERGLIDEAKNAVPNRYPQ